MLRREPSHVLKKDPEELGLERVVVAFLVLGKGDAKRGVSGKVERLHRVARHRPQDAEPSTDRLGSVPLPAPSVDPLLNIEGRELVEEEETEWGKNVVVESRCVAFSGSGIHGRRLGLDPVLREFPNAKPLGGDSALGDLVPHLRLLEKCLPQIDAIVFAICLLQRAGSRIHRAHAYAIASRCFEDARVAGLRASLHPSRSC